MSADIFKNPSFKMLLQFKEKKIDSAVGNRKCH